MNAYLTGAVIRELREKNHLTQAQLAEKLNISDKTISKWETAKGYPDINALKTDCIGLWRFDDGIALRQDHYKCKCISQYAPLKVLCLPGMRHCDS